VSYFLTDLQTNFNKKIMKYIKLTTPKGKIHIIPEDNNRAYYEHLNRSIKDESQRYKIEPYEEAKQQFATPAPANGNPSADIDLSAKVADLLPLIEVFNDVEKLGAYLKAEESSEKPRKTVIAAIQDRIEALAKE
jgi:hypothetical protein